MLRTLLRQSTNTHSCLVRASTDLSLRRLIQTSQTGFTSRLQSEIKYENVPEQPSNAQQNNNVWSRHTIPTARSFKDLVNKQKVHPAKETEKVETKAVKTEENPAVSAAAAPTAAAPTPKKRVRRSLKPRKALISLSPNAVEHLRALLDQPTPQLIRIGVKNRGCSGLTYNLEYIEKPGKFDEVVDQDGVRVVIDSKALFSIVGSEMDWLDDKLSSRFIFRNPNSKGTCGCGESFMV